MDSADAKAAARASAGISVLLREDMGYSWGLNNRELSFGRCKMYAATTGYVLPVFAPEQKKLRHPEIY
jgi:hypothetical protein